MVNILFWLFVLAFDLLLPCVMMGFGREFMKNPPKEINPGYGYRTTMSSKSQETWDFAQRYMGKVWYKAGRVLLVPHVPAQHKQQGQDGGDCGHDRYGRLRSAACDHAGLHRSHRAGLKEEF